MARSPLPAAALNARARAAKLVKAGDLAGALDAYQAAIAITPDDPDLLAEVARVAEALAAHEIAAALWARMALLAPDRPEAADGQARSLRELGRFDDAVAILREALLVHQEDARLWNALGVTLMQQGDATLAMTFLGEAIRLDPKLASALYNRAGVNFDLGHLDAAADDYAAARKAAKRPDEAASIDFAAATLALASGRLDEGWDAYEVRFSKAWPRSVAFEAPGRRWTPETALEGKRLLVLAEQGVGDELMFLTMLPDVEAALGPAGRLDVAVDPRLVPLVQRSYPDASVMPHATSVRGGRRRRSAPGVQDPRTVDVWAPIGSLTRRFRKRIEDFPSTITPLRADPERVAHWRAWLGEGPAVGLSWRSGKGDADRSRLYPAIDDWAPVLRSPGPRLVNVQYRADAYELARLSEIAGQPILTPPGIDLHDDLDDLAALMTALDAVVAVGNANAQLACLCGRPLVIVSPLTSWPRLGADAYPWLPTARLAACEEVGNWAPALERAAALLTGIIAAR